MVMYMDGFRFALSKEQKPCLNLFFSSWRLDSAGKFAGAIVGVLFLAVTLEGVAKIRQIMAVATRRRKVRSHTAAAAASAGDDDDGNDESARSCRVRFPRLRFLLATALHGVQALLGYVLMLAAMTFSIELLLAAAAGLALGRASFHGDESDRGDDDSKRIRRMNNDDSSSTPCCSGLGGGTSYVEYHYLVDDEETASRRPLVLLPENDETSSRSGNDDSTSSSSSSSLIVWKSRGPPR